jgi:hypothetical protein
MPPLILASAPTVVKIPPEPPSLRSKIQIYTTKKIDKPWIFWRFGSYEGYFLTLGGLIKRLAR